MRDLNKPVGLRNEGVNVCFFNSITQVLYCIPELREYIKSAMITNRYLNEMKMLFEKITNQVSSEPVKTSDHVKKLRLDGYRFRDQYDAHECLIKILDNLLV